MRQQITKMCDLKGKQNLVVGLHLEGKSNIEIHGTLPKLQLSEQFIHRDIKPSLRLAA